MSEGSPTLGGVNNNLHAIGERNEDITSNLIRDCQHLIGYNPLAQPTKIGDAGPAKPPMPSGAIPVLYELTIDIRQQQEKIEVLLAELRGALSVADSDKQVATRA